MAGIIPQDIIEQVRQASDIVDIINQYVRLKKRGRNFLALCPFHVEKTPSFSVSPDKQIFHCFGCGKGGNVFTFLMEHESMSFVEAVKHLAAKAGIRVPERKVDDKTKEQYERLHYAQQVALDYFKTTLYSDRYRDKILNYLHTKRNLTDESIELFQLGLAGEEWDGLLKHALKKELYPNDLVSAGLVIHSDKKDKYFDRFRQRLMIPIFSLSEKPIAFGGRALKKGEVAKYINSPETKLYSKSNVLYGLNFTKQFIRDKNEVIIVEGYFDLISLYQAGVKNVVASSGTAFTSQQARLLARFTDMAFLFFDADSAGQTAAVRSVDALYDAGIEVKVMSPPEGEDPDSVAVKHGAEKIEAIKEKALPYLEFRTRDIDMEKSGIIAREKLIKELAELAGKIGDPTRRRLFISEAAAVTQTDQSMLAELTISRQTPLTSPGDIRKPKKITDMEHDLISMILNYPEYIETVREQFHPDDFQSEDLKKIYSFILDIYKTHGAIRESVLFDYIEDRKLANQVSSLMILDLPDTNIDTQIKDHINRLLTFRRERVIDKLRAELKSAEENKDFELARELAAEIEELISKRGR
ncbi:MAG TPA: DNA primase [candidate division Zixibacteria bacterium]|nr:DNA primase [candidate division Zixibacteria bacterium]